MALGIRHANHVAPYPQKLALTSPTNCGRSVGTVRFRTQATEFSVRYFCETTVRKIETNECQRVTQEFRPPTW
jgi:hypothetical protein